MSMVPESFRQPASGRNVRRVLMTADGVGGVWQYVLDLSSALATRGVDVTVAVLGPPLDVTQQAAVARRGLHAVQHACKLEWMDDPWNDVARSGEWLRELADAFTPDIVHLNGYSHAALEWDVPVIVVAHSCVLSWWRAVRGEAAPASWNAYRTAVARGLESAAVIVAPTAAMRDALRAEHGCSRDIVVVPNGRDLGSGAYSASVPKSDLVLSVGRLWDDAKNVAALCETAGDLPWPVYVAGEWGSSRESDRLSRNVHYLGRLPAERVVYWCRQAAIYALPARYEPFGLSVLEAAACRCALVLGNIPSLRENWSDAAVFVDPDDRAALQRAIEMLIADAPARERLSRAAAARAAELTVTRMAESYLDVYDSTLRRVAVA
jgi:glycosyltransferase involved in cell wall biosynthesis